jgi:Mur ligase middle domain
VLLAADYIVSVAEPSKVVFTDEEVIETDSSPSEGVALMPLNSFPLPAASQHLASSSSTLAFIVSVLTVTLYQRLFHQKGGHIETTSSSYMSTLRRLFKVTVKAPSRHSDGTALSTNDLFTLRKDFFKNVCSRAGDGRLLQKAKIIHIAGTKGKGSTVEYISAGLRQGCKGKVGTFTSPHMHSARERIKIGTKLISEADMTRLGNQVLEEMSNISWAVFFDHLVALAMKYFSEQNVEYIVMETGIGGRYDSTNFIDNPAVSVITSISLDHQQLLGETVEKIAWQKAGIIKRNGHIFTPATQEPSVMEVFRKQCEEVNATLHIVPVDK